MIKKSLLVSLAAASLLASDANTSTMYERFNAMEKEMNALKAEIANLKAKDTASTVKKVSTTGDEDDKPSVQKTVSSDDDEDAPKVKSTKDPIPGLKARIADLEDDIDNILSFRT